MNALPARGTKRRKTSEGPVTIEGGADFESRRPDQELKRFKPIGQSKDWSFCFCASDCKAALRKGYAGKILIGLRA